MNCWKCQSIGPAINFDKKWGLLLIVVVVVVAVVVAW